ncbi:magnesium transporter-like protein [Phanerochaete sordida]|uniref:Magnesium transporter-like protein n=1 Tax=Phanerochaete sordida TaxID=48140 RepID=A0A9P3LCV2_9APHY|nr:magnesium transporter-like protein [Phanerochaete sordida]
MPRENSFSDSDGRSLTPDLDEELDAPSPVAANPPSMGPLHAEAMGRSLSSPHHEEPPIIEATAEPPMSAPASLREPTRVRSGKSTSSDRPRPAVHPADRFRGAVRKVIAMRRGSVALTGGVRVGAEPGIDPRRETAFLQYGHLRQKCLIEVVDYSAVRSSFGRMTNNEFIKLLADPRACAKEPWVKVRWINVGGVSWDVISALAIHYGMHPLAVEDLLHAFEGRSTLRSKVDYYQKHLFLRVLCHRLSTDEEMNTPDNSVTHLPRSSSPEPYDDESEFEESVAKEEEDEKTAYGGSSRFTTARVNTLRSAVNRRMSRDVEASGQTTRVNSPLLRFGDMSENAKKSARNAKLVRELTKGERVNVRKRAMCMFLFRDGTVITIHQDNKLDFTQPITDRLRQRDTGLRTTADASLLVESLLDLVVDQALEIVEAYHEKILKLEKSILLKPNMKHVRRLHIFQEELILHKRTLEPIKTVVYGLRRYDVDRVAALYETLDPGVKVQGYMSHKSKIYLADVHDHMEYILSNLDMFAGISENLINYTFNMSSYEMNEVMRRLTLATIIFLPLTLLTGYFGMNFTNMWTIQHNHSDLVFWIIALPLMAIVVPIFLRSDLERIFHYMKKKMTQRKLKKKLKTA